MLSARSEFIFSCNSFNRKCVIIRVCNFKKTHHEKIPYCLHYPPHLRTLFTSFTTEEKVYAGFTGNTVDEIKAQVAANAVTFVIYTGTNFDKDAFSKKAEQYSKMFSMTYETVSNNTTYTVKFNDGFSMKYLMRLFVSAGIKEVHFGTQVMETEKFFIQFEQ